jgi:hypothetical protein
MSTIPGAAKVYVLDGNKAALNLYQSEGFRQTEKTRSKNNGYPCTVLKLSQDLRQAK